mmetsp:Transcript_14330/g.24056  ORF Transcript_14330/g.24056 Transcript_14330/m.24056 type:complete len:120 (+) Transcript_14330:1134-1493(+)
MCHLLSVDMSCHTWQKKMFGFKTGGPHGRPNINGMDDAERNRNVNALTYSLTIMTLVPWTLTFIAYGFMTRTYESDVEKTIRRARKVAESHGLRDGDEELDSDGSELDKVQLLAEGRRG